MTSRFAPFLLLLTLAGIPAAAAQVPATIAYQGYLTDAAGTPLDGTANLAFRLYDAPTGGTAAWAESQLDVPVTGGVFSVHLGSHEDLSDVAFDRPLWLAVQVNGGAELSPRTALEAAPYALSVRGLRLVPGTDDDFGTVPNLIAGHADNRVEGPGTLGAVINGGGGDAYEQVVTRSFGTIGGGFGNRVTGTGATVGGGRNNEALGCYDTVGGGDGNRAQTDAFTASAKASGFTCNATVGGGRGNVAAADGATVAGGTYNRATRPSAVVAGGNDNAASGTYAAVPGGRGNQARGETSLAAGRNARAAHDGSFVWADSRSDSLVSTAEDQFLIGAAGGVGIGTDAPKAALHVSGPVALPDLVLGGTGDSITEDDGVLASDPDLPSSDLLLVANDAVAVVIGLEDSNSSPAFLVTDDRLRVAFQVDTEGRSRTNRLEVSEDLGPNTTPAEGGLYRDNVVYAWAHVNGNGALVDGFGCTVQRTGTGTYRVTYKRPLANGAAPVVSPLSANDPVIATVTPTSTSVTTVKVFEFVNGLFQAGDRPFFIQVVGRP